jgi:hypothetical protein
MLQHQSAQTLSQIPTRSAAILSLLNKSIKDCGSYGADIRK